MDIQRLLVAIMEDNEIVQQPADLLTLSENLAKAGVKFIEEASGLSKINMSLLLVV